MKIDLAGIVRRSGTYRRATFTAGRIDPTAAQRGDLLRIYMRIVRGWQVRFRDRILPAYERALSELITDDAESLQFEFGLSERQLQQLAVAAGLSVDDFIKTTEAWHRRRFAQAFAPTGVNIGALLDRADVKTTLDAVIGENVALIRSLDDQMRNGISGATFRALQNRTTGRDLAREIRGIAGAGQRRAELIASDQLQKLTGLLDEQRQRQAGIDKFEWAHSGKANPREIHKARDGKVYAWTDPVAKTDPPGRAIRCGCRARAVLEIDEDAAGETESAPEPVAPPKPKPVPPPAPVVRGFRSPINPDVRDETVKVAPRLQTAKALAAEFAAVQRGADIYQLPKEFRSRGGTDFGKASFSAAFDDETVSAIAALKPELDNLADQIGIPRLRGFKTVTGSKAMANQGDGVMGVNPVYFNGFADRVGNRAGGATGKLQTEMDGLTVEMRALGDDILARREILAAMDKADPRRDDAMVELYRQIERHGKMRAKYDAIWRKSRAVEKTGRADVSRWQRGDAVKERPFTADSFFSGIDRARTVLFHEFGHHVHQYLKKAGHRRAVGAPPLERELTERWRGKFGDNSDRYVRQATTYAATNEHEWWAENFALFVMGRRDLVDPKLTDLIESIFDGTY